MESCELDDDMSAVITVGLTTVGRETMGLTGWCFILGFKALYETWESFVYGARDHGYLVLVLMTVLLTRNLRG